MTEEAPHPMRKPRRKNIPRGCSNPTSLHCYSRATGGTIRLGADVADLVPRQWHLFASGCKPGATRWLSPITDDGPLVGISIISAEAAAEALAIAAADPRVKAGRLRVEVHSALFALAKRAEDQLFMSHFELAPINGFRICVRREIADQVRSCGFTARLCRLRKNSCFVSGHDFSRAENSAPDEGFSP